MGAGHDEDSRQEGWSFNTRRQSNCLPALRDVNARVRDLWGVFGPSKFGYAVILGAQEYIDVLT